MLFGLFEFLYLILFNYSIFVVINWLFFICLIYIYYDEEINWLNVGVGNMVFDYGLFNINMDFELGNGFIVFVYGWNIIDEEYFLEFNVGVCFVGVLVIYGVGVCIIF